MLTTATDNKLTPEVFRDLRTFIYDRSGMYFDDNKLYLLEMRLQPRLRERNCKSFQDYLMLLKHDAWRDQEVTQLFALVTTNETYFWRDLPQLDAIIKTAIPAIQEANKATRRIRIWSAACSTGDEPYGLAMMLMETPALADWHIDITGSDISETALASARKGIYGSYAVRYIPPALLKKYFTQQDGQYVLGAEPRRMVRFANINLTNPAAMVAVRGVDIILCRNCLIYFDDHSRRQVLQRFYDCLTPSGYMVLGFSESLHNLTRTFRPLHSDRAVLYRKL